MTHRAIGKHEVQSQSSSNHRTRSLIVLLALMLFMLTKSSHSQSTRSDRYENPVLAKAAGLRLGASHVKLRLDETVSSANAKIGDSVLLEVVDPVVVDGKVIIAAGAPAHGTVTKVKHRGRNHREGQLQLTVKTVTRVDGREALLQSATVQQGSGQAEPIFGPCTFPLPADPVGLFRKGKDVVIPKGTELIAAIGPSNP